MMTFAEVKTTGQLPPRIERARWALFFELFRQYWFSSDWKFAWLGLGVLLFYQFGFAYLLVAMNSWQQAFYDSLATKDVHRFFILILGFLGLLFGQLGSLLLNTFFDTMLSIRWRSYLTRTYMTRWLKNNRLVEIERLRVIDNPDQRIAEDIALLTQSSTGMLGLLLGYVGVTVTSLSFIFVLLRTAAPIHLRFAGLQLDIPGSTIWYAFIYVGIGSFVITKIGAPFVRRNIRQQHVEATFRSNLMHVRRHAEQIALSGAQPTELATLEASFSHIRSNFTRLVFTSLGLQLGQGIYERIGSMIALFLVVPQYFSGAITFGQLMGAKGAFENLTAQLSYYVQSYALLGRQMASLARLQSLEEALEDRPAGGIVFGTGLSGKDCVLVTTGLTVFRPNGQALVSVPEWRVRAGDRWVIRGASGAGKSTLLRAVVGLWPDGEGAIDIPVHGALMVVPQRLYLPLGSLKSAICFPQSPEAVPDDTALTLLDRVGLSAHKSQLHEVKVWQEVLSPGEQQRISLMRILLQRPSVLLLDEATSALDAHHAELFYQLVLSELPDVTVLSIVHDDNLMRFHSDRLDIETGVAKVSKVVSLPAH